MIERESLAFAFAVPSHSPSALPPSSSSSPLLPLFPASLKTFHDLNFSAKTSRASVLAVRFYSSVARMRALAPLLPLLLLASVCESQLESLYEQESPPEVLHSSAPASPPAACISKAYPYDGSQVCITERDISDAILEAKQKLGWFVPQEVFELSSEFPKPVHVAVSAEMIEEATRILAHRFGLDRQAILFTLPRLDTSKSAAREICPTFLQPVKCELSPYRTLTGMCNNLNYPSWGASRSAMIRLLPPDYADGESDECLSLSLSPPASASVPLPPPQRLSSLPLLPSSLLPCRLHADVEGGRGSGDQGRGRHAG